MDVAAEGEIGMVGQHPVLDHRDSSLAERVVVEALEEPALLVADGVHGVEVVAMQVAGGGGLALVLGHRGDDVGQPADADVVAVAVLARVGDLLVPRANAHGGGCAGGIGVDLPDERALGVVGELADHSALFDAGRLVVAGPGQGSGAAVDLARELVAEAVVLVPLRLDGAVEADQAGMVSGPFRHHDHQAASSADGS
jgi:hypothetical protein